MEQTLQPSSEDLRILQSGPVRTLLSRIEDAVRVTDAGVVEIVDESRLRGDAIELLAAASALDTDEDARDTARWIIGEVGHALGIVPASIHDLYIARGRGDISGFTVPAMNIRGMAFDSARALFAAARELKVGALICEIARSEIGYTDQRPAEYVASITAAAIREGWSGPLFIQGDHFQINAKKYAADPEPEVRAVRDIIREGLHAGFYNIDVDTSTLVDLSKGTLEEQQELNSRLSAELTAYIRKHEPEGVTVSVGGEIGEVGTENSTAGELRAYMDGYNKALAAISSKVGEKLEGLSKISVQSGTSHGGVVLPDGSIADVAIDFETLRDLSKIARNEYGLAGAVQHGASTLPQTAFGKFPEVETAEIHLATNFQNIIFEHPRFPSELREKMYEHCRENLASERGASDTEEQFIYKTRKKTLGEFKRELWEMSEDTRAAIRDTLRQQFAFLFKNLAAEGTSAMVKKHVHPKRVRRSGPAALRIKAAADDWDLSD